MKFFVLLNAVLLCLTTCTVLATDIKAIKISDVISKEEFSLYKDVGEFIEHSPKVTIIVQPELSDINEYGKGVVKSLTGTDCDRDGKMDDNATCNAVYVKLWLKYKR